MPGSPTSEEREASALTRPRMDRCCESSAIFEAADLVVLLADTDSVRLPDRLTGQYVLPYPESVAEAVEVRADRVLFVEPSGLVQLILLMHWLHQRSSRVKLVAPLNVSVDAYLNRMDFYEHLPADIEIDARFDHTHQQRQNRADVLVPLTHVRTYDQDPNHAETEIDQIGLFLQEQRMPRGMRDAVWTAVAELCGNAASHSASLCGAFMAAQTYVAQRRHIAVGDLGIGIRRHLANNPLHADLPNDAEAIKKAIEPGVTGTRDRRGYGLDEVQNEAGNAGRARLTIRSGNGLGRITIDGEHRTTEFVTIEQGFPGTLVELMLPPAG